MAAAAILNFIFVQYFGTSACKISRVMHMPNFVQICAIVNELWAIDKVQNGDRRHLQFIIFVHFGQMFYFRWKPSTQLQNFIHLRQSAAELLLFVQKSKMAAAVILNLSFLSILVKWSVSGGSRLPCCKISFIYINRRLSNCCLCKNPTRRPPPSWITIL